MDVADESSGYRWALSDKDEDYANLQRSLFADAVLARAVQLQQPPHNYPKRPGEVA